MNLHNRSKSDLQATDNDKVINFDSRPRSSLDLPPPYANIELLPFDNFGWFPEINAFFLKLLIEKHSIRTIVEVGSHFGLSTRYMAKLLPTGGKVYAVDHWLSSPAHLSKPAQQFQSDIISEGFTYAMDQWLSSNVDQSKRYQQFLSNVIHEGLTDMIIPLRLRSLDGAKYLSNTKIDLVYIDAAHDEESVYNELTVYYPLIQGHGILCGDDYVLDHPGVISAVQRFTSERNLICNVGRRFWFINEAENPLKLTNSLKTKS